VNRDCMADQEQLQDCPNCGNSYLAIRTDMYKDEREFVYCDCCGCITERDVWNRVSKRPELVPKEPATSGANRFDFEQQIMKCWNVTDDIDTLYKGVGDVGMTEDQIMNVLLGMKEIYDLKFNELFSTFEQLIKKKAL
jgi:hypothetical protein